MKRDRVMNETLKPLGDKILVKRTEPEHVSKGGIIIPEIAKSKPLRGTVTAIGDCEYEADGKSFTKSVKVGDTIVFGSYAGTEIKIDAQDYLIISVRDVLAVVVSGSDSSGDKFVTKKSVGSSTGEGSLAVADSGKTFAQMRGKFRNS